MFLILENRWSVPGLEPPDGNPFHALIGVHTEEEEKESEDEEEDLEEDMEEEEEDGDEEEIHVTWRRVTETPMYLVILVKTTPTLPI